MRLIYRPSSPASATSPWISWLRADHREKRGQIWRQFLFSCLFVVMAGCGEKKPPTRWDFDFANFAERTQAVLANKEPESRIAAIRALLAELEPGLAISRQARITRIGLLDALMGTLVVADRPEEALAVEKQRMKDSREYLRLDPQDGHLLAVIAERLYRTEAQEEAWSLLEEHLGEVDASTAHYVIEQATHMLDDLESKHPDRGPKPWRERYLALAAKLRKAASDIESQGALNFEILNGEAKVLMRQGRFDEAESCINKLLEIDASNTDIVELEQALIAARQHKR